MDAPQTASLEAVTYGASQELLSASELLQSVRPTRQVPQAMSCSLAHPCGTPERARERQRTNFSDFLLPKDLWETRGQNWMKTKRKKKKSQFKSFETFPSLPSTTILPSPSHSLSFSLLSQFPEETYGLRWASRSKNWLFAFCLPSSINAFWDCVGLGLVGNKDA